MLTRPPILCPMPGSSSLTPVYRRFEALNHRLLLQVQDEIVQLEQELESLDAEDTMSRYGPMGCAPASRRAESMAQGELGWRKHALYMDIGLKLAQYSKLIESFRTMQSLPPPSVHEVGEYKAFLARTMAICEPETRFLQVENDLMSMPRQEWDETGPPEFPGDFERGGPPFEQLMPPMPAPPLQLSPKLDTALAGDAKVSATQAHELRNKSPLHLVYAAFLAVAIPVATFTVVHGLGERMVIVLLVFSGVATAVYQSGLVAEQGVVECVGCAGLYGMLMAGLAHVFVY
ncbi:uncharacterized protein J7T54_003004 [Emericellopsis cladophorae]|uniref:DUF6594 domain-containing protein n=1 Tax=Emericellopsis cladophorae TaxID=2686198 RepID=A0A9P9XZC0_9HYPO|nr:uncharacterized protein J7T54_003004 [Emericellopsis cladophorae]KAI6780225.1 hypothetical protein J7T54_003004 [Emericellopsis cladophorae]